MRVFPARQVLALLGANAHTGTFDAESGEKRVRILFREGRIDWAEGSGEADAQSIVTDLVSWSDGSFTFLDAVELPAGISPLALDAVALLAEAEKRVAEAQKMLQLFPDDQTVFRVVPKPEGDISLRPAEFQVLFQIGNGRSLAQLRGDMKMAVLDLYPIVHTLKSRGLIATAGDATTIEPQLRKSGVRKKPAADTIASGVTPIPKKTAGHRKATPRIATLTADDGTMHPLLEETNAIGRIDGNAIVISEGSVSSRHARIVRSADGFAIDDLGSRNGTFVNGEKVTEQRALTDGDTVRFGKVVLTFNIAAEARPQESTQPEIGMRRNADS